VLNFYFSVQDDEFQSDDKPKPKEVTKNDDKEVADDKEQDDEEDEEEDEEADDEIDEILRASPVTESPSQLKKYVTNKPKKVPEKSRTSKPMDSFDEQPKKVKPSPTPTAAAVSVSIDTKEDKNGVTPSTEVITTTMISTSMKGSATLKPLDMPIQIPLKTAKDDAEEEDDDDEEEDNHKYNEDDANDSKYHRVTLEELVGDIKLSPGDFQMMGSRRGRSMNMKLSLDKVTPNKHIQAKIRQMRMVK